MEAWLKAWQNDFMLAGCEHCDWIFLLPQMTLPDQCPHCARPTLATMDETADKPVYSQPPEQILPFGLPVAQVEPKLTAFAKEGIFAPADLVPARLHGSLQPIFLPIWLVDVDAQADWQAEMGYDYEVVSHQEAFRQNQWHTRELKETRQRWEPRVGTLQRHYPNQPAPALEAFAALEKRVGPFDRSKALAYDGEIIRTCVVRLPNRAPADAWLVAQAGLKQIAKEECRQAAAADHIRQYKWRPNFSDAHWTQLLVPLYTTFYRDDTGETHIIYIHGQTGRLSGQRRASMKKARSWSLGIGLIAALLFGLALLAFVGGLIYPQIMVLTGLFFFLGSLTAVGALVPILYAWYTNQQTDLWSY